jgi:hypothetical protein
MKKFLVTATLSLFIFCQHPEYLLDAAYMRCYDAAYKECKDNTMSDEAEWKCTSQINFICTVKADMLETALTSECAKPENHKE